MSAEQGPNYALESWEDVKHRVVKIKSDLEVTKDEKFELQDELKTVRGQAEEVRRHFIGSMCFSVYISILYIQTSYISVRKLCLGVISPAAENVYT